MVVSASPFPALRVNDVSGAIVSSAMHVHSVLGPGLLESAYQGCLAHELRKRGFEVASQVGLPVVFDGEKIELGYRIDLVVENLVIVEVKSVEANSPCPSSSAFVVHATEWDRSWASYQFLRDSPARWNQTHGRWEELGQVTDPKKSLTQGTQRNTG
jgi:GxxExxY protein